MHFKTDRIDFPIAGVDPFLATQETVERRNNSILEISGETLPKARVTILLEHAR
jgi:hypothetical protein